MIYPKCERVDELVDDPNSDLGRDECHEIARLEALLAAIAKADVSDEVREILETIVDMMVPDYE